MTIGELIVRPERPGDEAGIGEVVSAAFGGAAEAGLVARLRAEGALAVSLVALADGEVVGHVAFSPVTVEGCQGGGRWLGLAPLAVRPDRQRQGIGRRLVGDAVSVAARDGAAIVFVLGHPAYYEALGFAEASPSGWRCTYDVPSAAFRARPLAAPANLPPPGTVRYHGAFETL